MTPAAPDKKHVRHLHAAPSSNKYQRTGRYFSKRNETVWDADSGLEEIVLELFENERWNLDPAKGQVGARSSRGGLATTPLS